MIRPPDLSSLGTPPETHYCDPEGFTRYGGGCACGPIYTYAGIPEPGQFSPDCPTHGDTPGDNR